MASVPSHSIDRKCKLCNAEKTHYLQGIYVAPVCMDCMRTLPPILPGQRRCPTCLDLHSRKSAYCKACRRSYAKEHYNYEDKRDAHLRRTYNITLEEYNLLFFKQGGLCAICHQPEWIIDPYTKQTKWLVLDHNHGTGEPRELLCHRCNIVLGELESNRHVVRKMLRYLQKHDR